MNSWPPAASELLFDRGTNGEEVEHAGGAESRRSGMRTRHVAVYRTDLFMTWAFLLRRVRLALIIADGAGLAIDLGHATNALSADRTLKPPENHSQRRPILVDAFPLDQANLAFA